MKVILLQDVKGTGKKGQVVEVSDGFGRNFLLAKKMAKIATAESINAAKAAESAEKHRKAIEKSEAQALAQQLEGKKVTIRARTGENGKLFGAITNKEVAEAVRDQLGMNVDKRQVELDSAIKHLGSFEASVRVYAETIAKISVEVAAQE